MNHTEVKLTNISTAFMNGRSVAIATVRTLDDVVLRRSASVAEQLSAVKMAGATIVNSEEVLYTLVTILGFSA